ncbi:uncharacterized protein LOC126881623 [Diabrotica virgifera virgifera]|uniref:Uncharacterized protein LOC114338720 n=1 Tax=Diabrotica virgifera virgifera TaxID=50390 RepID=A0A6P7G7U5_DIAVI|nr:uncharacterized protein LOC126881623 [Diabrotica virgifera virgifera]
MSSNEILHEGSYVSPEFLTMPAKNSKLLSSTLWLVSSMYSAAKLDFSSNMAGVSIGFNLQDVLLIILTAWMLNKGLATRNVALIFPWVIAATYGLYYNHYKSLVRMTSTLKPIKHATPIPWIALFVTSMGLVLKAILIFRILQLSANLWYRKKLENELYQP